MMSGAVFGFVSWTKPRAPKFEESWSRGPGKSGLVGSLLPDFFAKPFRRCKSHIRGVRVWIVRSSWAFVYGFVLRFAGIIGVSGLINEV